VPENEEVKKAITHGLPTWEDVAAETSQDKREIMAEKIIRFLRYHFQDNAVFVDKPVISGAYQTATIDTTTHTFFKLTLKGGDDKLDISTGNGSVVDASVVTTPGLYNIMARDFKFNTPNPSNATTIATSSYIVIHQINKCLYYKGEYDDLGRLNSVRKKSGSVLAKRLN
jgi:hypothetical protein